MNRKSKALFIAMVLVAAVFLSGCVGSDSAKESDSGSDEVTEKVDPVTLKENTDDKKMMSIPDENTTDYSADATSNNTSVASNYYIGGISGSGKSSSSGDINTVDTVQITDMLGRKLTVNKDIDSVVATSPPSTILIYMLAPDKLAGWNFVNNFNPTYMDEKYFTLPTIGGWYGTTTGNYETFIAMKPDIVIEGYTTDGDIDDAILRRQENFGSIPVVAINDSFIFVEYGDPSIEFVGELLDREEQAESFIEFRRAILDEIDSKTSGIPDEERVHVYYAEGPKGLATDPSGSQHSQVIDICGGINVANCTLIPGNGMTAVSIEQVMEWNPEIIITSNSQFYKSVYSDPLWADIDAVKNKQVYLAPQNPFCWIDRPQGPHLIIGTAWTAKVLYPDLFTDMDLENLTLEFYSDFLHYDLTDEELESLLNP